MKVAIYIVRRADNYRISVPGTEQIRTETV